MSSTLPPTFEEKDLNYYLRMIRSDFSDSPEEKMAPTVSSSRQKNIVIMLSDDRLGVDEKNFGQKLLLSFLKALQHNRSKPRAIVLFNRAVLLCRQDSACCETLSLLQEQGVRVMACVESTDDYGISDDLGVGYIADMDNIVDLILTAWKVISL